MRYLYLHGLGSGPNSAKAKYLAARFRSRGLELELLDFNLDSLGAFDFAGLSLTRNILRVKEAIAWQASAGIAHSTEPVTLIGSSLGGLTAAWAAQDCPQVERLVLLAPAFEFLAAWLPSLGEAAVGQWQKTGQLKYFHYGQGQKQPLSYGFVTDLVGYDEGGLTRSLPTLILHGKQDETVPLSASQQYSATRDWVQLIELDSDHGLGNSVSHIWREIQKFCQLG